MNLTFSHFVKTFTTNISYLTIAFITFLDCVGGRCQPVNIEYKFALIIFGLVLLWLVSWTPYAFVALLGISGNEARLTPG